jgi:glycine/D-amino acid oxidase-like deaminating enzyme
MLPRRVRCAVIGMGALGSAAAYRLARRLGDEVLVLEQFAPGHTRGASEDHSRIIRHSYASTVYTRLTPAMFAAWREVEAESALSLVTTAGGLDVGDPAVPGSVEAIENNAAALRDQKIGFELVDGNALRARWPQWHVADDVRAVFQADSGSLDIGRACGAHLELARRCGARLHPGVRVLGVTPASDRGSVGLQTDDGVVEADDLVVCAGKWTNRVLGEIGQLPLTYTREQVTYFVPPSLAEFAPERFPVWIRPGEPCFYGLGTHGVPAIKAGEDLGGPEVEVDDEESPISARRELRVADFLAKHLPGAVGPVAFSRACLYELPADRDFILGPLPGEPRVRVAIGAGHAAKFAALLGLVLSEMVLDGASCHPVAPFRVDRLRL